MTNVKMHTAIEEMLSLPLGWDRAVLRPARELMQEYAGKGYRADLLPLYPLGKEIRSTFCIGRSHDTSSRTEILSLLQGGKLSSHARVQRIDPRYGRGIGERRPVPSRMSHHDAKKMAKAAASTFTIDRHSLCGFALGFVLACRSAGSRVEILRRRGAIPTGEERMW